MTVSIIVPCFNEEAVIAETYKRLTATAKQFPHEYELVFVNDGSRDGTFAILCEIAKSDKCVKIVNFSRNFGHQCAVTAGLRNCKGNVAAIIDADLQDPPEIIAEMLQIMQHENANVVYGVRKQRKGENWFKLFTAKMFYRLLNFLSDSKFPVDTGDFRLIDRKVIDAFCALKEKNKYIRGLISWLGFKQIPCYYDRAERFAGETKYPFRKMLHFALIGLFYFSKKPLKMATTLGFVCIILGIVYVLQTFVKLLMGVEFVHGWASTIMIIIFFGGVQLLTIGVLGQYIGNIFDESKDRPEYVINEKINF